MIVDVSFGRKDFTNTLLRAFSSGSIVNQKTASHPWPDERLIISGECHPFSNVSDFTGEADIVIENRIGTPYVKDSEGKS